MLQEIVHKKIDDLIFAEYNPRQLTDDQYQQLKDSITRFGLVDPVIVNKHKERKDIIIGGHQRVKVAKTMGIEEVPCVEIELTYEKERELNVRLNKNTGEWDKDVLANNFDIEELLEWGFNEEELSIPELEPEEGLTDPDAIPEVKEPICEMGQLWMLGEHKLLCGDATKPEDVKKLFGDDKANLIFTDPPYGVSYTGTSGESTKEWDPINGDDLRDEQLYEFLLASFQNLDPYTEEGTAAYVFHASSTQIEFQKALEASTYRIKQQLIWHKGMVLSRSDYHWTHEPMFYAVKGKKNCIWYGDRTHRTIANPEERAYDSLSKKELIAILKQMEEQSTTWEIKKDAAVFYKHPTQKPVDLSIRAIKNNTKPGEIVVDTFSGSGSTLMGAECTKRKCLALEYDPVYCDVIITRWEQYTGRKAELCVE